MWGRFQVLQRLLVDQGAYRLCSCSATSVSVVTVFSGSDDFFCLLLRPMLLFSLKPKERKKEKDNAVAIILDAIDRG